MLPMPTDTEPSGVKALKGLFTRPKPVNALELGCRVGIFGRGLSVVFPKTLPPPSRRCTILMADLEEAESNQIKHVPASSHPIGAQVQHCSSCKASLLESRLRARPRGSVWLGSIEPPLGLCPAQRPHLQRGHASRPARDAFRVARVQHGRNRRAAAVYKSFWRQSRGTFGRKRCLASYQIRGGRSYTGRCCHCPFLELRRNVWNCSSTKRRDSKY